MPTPYNTGKVKIGECYMHRQTYVPSRDMARLQRALIDPTPSRAERMANIVLAILIGVAFGVLLAVGLSS